jgi:hypothetical protein
MSMNCKLGKHCHNNGNGFPSDLQCHKKAEAAKLSANTQHIMKKPLLHDVRSKREEMKKSQQELVP